MQVQQLIINLKDTIEEQRERYKQLEAEMNEIKRVNKVLDIENKVAVSLLLGNKRQPNDPRVDRIINALQYIIDCDNDSSSNDM